MNHGRNPAYLRIDDDEDVTDERLLEIVWSRYDFVSLGQSYRATEMEAALGIGQLERHEAMLSARGRIAAQLTEVLSKHGELRLPITLPGNDHAFMMFPIVATERDLRDRLVVALERAGVESRFLLPILGQPAYRGRLEYPEGTFPATEWAMRGGFYIGSHHHMTSEDVAHVGAVVDSILG
jgi:dTDP-4-amino-4,6-dideoxygalactose transaminase